MDAYSLENPLSVDYCVTLSCIDSSGVLLILCYYLLRYLNKGGRCEAPKLAEIS